MEAKGKVLLKVAGILMIIGGALSIILSVVFAMAAAALTAAGGPKTIIVGLLITILGSVTELIAGILCTRYHAEPAAAVKCMVWSCVTILLQVVGAVLVISGTNVLASETGQMLSGGVSAVLSIILGAVVPVLAVIGALRNLSGKGTEAPIEDTKEESVEDAQTEPDEDTKDESAEDVQTEPDEDAKEEIPDNAETGPEADVQEESAQDAQTEESH